MHLCITVETCQNGMEISMFTLKLFVSTDPVTVISLYGLVVQFDIVFDVPAPSVAESFT